jgi:hypothetical protein
VSGRQSRKRRRRDRRPVPPLAGAGEAPKPSKDDIAREHLKPLARGERPTAVTVAAIVAALIAASNLIAYAAGLEIDDHEFTLGEVLPPAVLMIVMAVGMWLARYWAVLGFQTLLVFLILVVFGALLTASNALAVIVSLLLLAGAVTLFWFLVKSLARIQMPDRGLPPR